jgi:hypothetical protein
MFEGMSEKYCKHVEASLMELEPKAEHIRYNIGRKFPKAMMSASFRMKDKNRIAAKDVSDYGGIKSTKTQVTDIFAARLAPGRGEVKNKTPDEINEIKMKYVEDIGVLFENEGIDINVFQKDKTIGDRNITIVYIIFHRHIELQVVTLDEYEHLEDSHEQYEEDRVKGKINTGSCLAIYILLQNVCVCVCVCVCICLNCYNAC